MRREVELKKLSNFKDSKIQAWIRIVRTLDALVLILAIGFGVTFAIYLYVE